MTHHWYGTVLTIELLQYFFDPTPTEVDVFLACLVFPEPQISRIAISVLSKSPAPRVTAIAEQSTALLLKDYNSFITRNIIVLLGLFGRRPEPNIGSFIEGLTTKLIALKDPSKQEFGITLLGCIGQFNKFSTTTLSTMLETLIAENINLKTTPPKARTLSLILAAVNAITDIGEISPSLLKILFNILETINDQDVRIAIFLCLKSVKKPKENLNQFREQLETLVRSPTVLLREVTLKIIRIFGGEFAFGSLPAVIPLLNDSHHSCRKNAIKVLSCIAKTQRERSSESGEAVAIQFAPYIASSLHDTNHRVLVELLQLIHSFKPKREQLYVEIIDTPTESIYLGTLINPNLERLISLPQQFPTKDICMGVLLVLGESSVLRNALQHFKQVLNTEQVSTIADFAEAWQLIVPEALQHLPYLFSSLQPTHSLVRHCVRLLQLHINILSPESCDSLFPIQCVEEMFKHRSPSVRTIAIQILGKKCVSNPQLFKKAINAFGQ